MGEIFWFMFLGHLLGDYVFQNSWMALNKKNMNVKGWVACSIHCTIYTICVVLMVNIFTNYHVSNFQFFLLYLSHYVLDRTHFVEFWSKFYGTRIWNTHIKSLDDVKISNFTKEESIYLSFGTFVYIMLDNAIHLVLMTLILKFVNS